MLSVQQEALLWGKTLGHVMNAVRTRKMSLIVVSDNDPVRLLLSIDGC